jgi:hypothetical protein
MHNPHSTAVVTYAAVNVITHVLHVTLCRYDSPGRGYGRGPVSPRFRGGGGGGYYDREREFGYDRYYRDRYARRSW